MAETVNSKTLGELDLHAVAPYESHYNFCYDICHIFYKKIRANAFSTTSLTKIYRAQLAYLHTSPHRLIRSLPSSIFISIKQLVKLIW